MIQPLPSPPEKAPEALEFDEGRDLRRKILITVCLALMAVIAAVTGLNVAQPHLAVEFQASQSTVLWMINSYTISLAALLLPLGAVGDRWGRRPMLLAGLGVFGAASALSGLSLSSEMMIVARLLSGVGAAMIMPVTLAVITSTFPDAERSKAIGVWTGVAGGGGIIGMYLSAILVDWAHWRWLFLLPVVLAIVAGVMTLRFVPNSREKTEHGFDFVGSFFSVLAVVGLSFVLDEGPRHGWTAPFTVGALMTGVLSAIGFVVWESRQQAPLLDFRLFRQRGLSSGSISLLTLFGVQAGIFIVLFPYFQAVLGWSGLRSTLALMPMAIAMMVCSGLAPKLAARIGARLTMALGVFIGGIGLALMALLVTANSGYLSILPGMLAWGFGTGIAMMPSTEAITASLPREQQGVASALNDVTRELGTALGVALLGSLVTAGYSHAISGRLQGLPEPLTRIAREGLANAVAASQQAGPQATILIQAARESFVIGWQQAMWVGVAVTTVLCLYILLLGPTPQETAV